MAVMDYTGKAIPEVCWGTTTTTSDATRDWQYYALEPIKKYAIRIEGDMSISGNISSKQWDKLEEEVKKLKEANKMAQMGLFEVYVVDTKNRKYMSNILIAKDESAAKLKQAQGLQRWLDDNKINEDFIEYFVRTVGIWKDKKPKEVKIVKE